MASTLTITPPVLEVSEAAYLAFDPLPLLSQDGYPSSAAWLEAGTVDHGPWMDHRRLAAASRRAGMEQACLPGIPGGHSWQVPKTSPTAALPWLPWLSWRLNISTKPTEGFLPMFPIECSRVDGGDAP